MHISHLSNLCKTIHADNVAAGWWPEDTSQRNRAEVLMLCVSELSEAHEGLKHNLKDDKLPHRKMFEVELADCFIRIADLCGAEGYTFPDNTVPSPHAGRLQLMDIVDHLSRAMEGHRKSDLNLYRASLQWAIHDIEELAEQQNFDLEGAIKKKRAFNANRADHKIENRMKEGGKRY